MVPSPGSLSRIFQTMKGSKPLIPKRNLFGDVVLSLEETAKRTGLPPWQLKAGGGPPRHFLTSPRGKERMDTMHFLKSEVEKWIADSISGPGQEPITEFQRGEALEEYRNRLPKVPRKRGSPIGYG